MATVRITVRPQSEITGSVITLTGEETLGLRALISATSSSAQQKLGLEDLVAELQTEIDYSQIDHLARKIVGGIS